MTDDKPPCFRDDALAVLLRLREHGHVAYFAGGCVRDLLLGRDPKDWDVATDAPPPRVRRLFTNTQAVGAAFGVILVKHARSTIEVATFRTDGDYSDGRRPDAVAFATAAEDAARRDFTINGLFLDPAGGSGFQVQGSGKTVPTAHGIVIDHVGGVADLEARVLRAIGDPDRRFAEDHLRLLRAVRFAARFGLAVDPGTAAAIRRHAPKLKGISPERIAGELRAALTPPTRDRAWSLLWDYALVDVIFRFLPPSEAVDFDLAKSVFLRTAPDREIPFGLALAAGALDYRVMGAPAPDAIAPTLLRAVQRKEVLATGRAVREALRVSNDELEAVTAVLDPLATLLADPEPGLAAKRRFLARSTAPETRELLRALARLNLHPARVAQLESAFDAIQSAGDVAPPPLITGDDLVAAGLKPGPVFKRILDAVYDAQLEGRVTDREGAMALVRHTSGGR